eukprot:8295127-Heterocapsa_arctica.AAC.1
MATARRKAMPADLPAWRTSRAGRFRNSSSWKSRYWSMNGVSTLADPRYWRCMRGRSQPRMMLSMSCVTRKPRSPRSESASLGV